MIFWGDGCCFTKMHHFEDVMLTNKPKKCFSHIFYFIKTLHFDLLSMDCKM